MYQDWTSIIAAVSLRNCWWTLISASTSTRIIHLAFPLAYLSYVPSISITSFILLFLLLAEVHLECSFNFVRPRVPARVNLSITVLDWYISSGLNLSHRTSPPDSIYRSASALYIIAVLGSSPLSCPFRFPTCYFADVCSAPASIIFTGFYTLAKLELLHASF